MRCSQWLACSRDSMVGTHPPSILIYTLSQYPLLALDIPRDYHNYTWKCSSALKVPSPITGQAVLHLRSRSKVPPIPQTISHFFLGVQCMILPLCLLHCYNFPFHPASAAGRDLVRTRMSLSFVPQVPGRAPAKQRHCQNLVCRTEQ